MRHNLSPLRISSGNRGVCATFAIEFEPFGEAATELVQEGFLLGGGFAYAAQTDLTAVGGGQHDVGALSG